MHIPNDIWDRCTFYRQKYESATDDLASLKSRVNSILWEMYDAMEYSESINDMAVYYKLEAFYNKFREILEEEF